MGRKPGLATLFTVCEGPHRIAFNIAWLINNMCCWCCGVCALADCHECVAVSLGCFCVRCGHGGGWVTAGLLCSHRQFDHSIAGALSSKHQSRCISGCYRFTVGGVHAVWARLGCH
jgi:hypothetical protein